MRKTVIFLVLACILSAIPGVSFTEDSATVRLARTIYAMAKTDDYETKLAVGTVVMNRLESPWYPDTLEEVLAQKQQFPCGTRYDDDSLRAAHEVLSGARVLDADVIALQARDAAAPRDESNLVASIGGYNFYNTQAK